MLGMFLPPHTPFKLHILGRESQLNQAHVKDPAMLKQFYSADSV